MCETDWISFTADITHATAALYLHPQNRQLAVHYHSLKYQVDGFVGKLTFLNSSIDTFCQQRINLTADITHATAALYLWGVQAGQLEAVYLA